MSWKKEFDIRDEGTKIVFECKLQAIPSNTPVKNIGPGDKVRITTTDVYRIITTETNHKIGNLIEGPPNGEVRNYFVDNTDLIAECWIFEKKQEKPKAAKKTAPKAKKTLAKKITK
jgi:hypothetical protein